jgi:ADP-heptose:LPS heptosyltransferase/GT2 family glycosyltransferase
VTPAEDRRPPVVGEEPPLLMAVDQPAAGSIFSRGGRLTGVGWVLSRSSVAEISVFAGETHLGYATYGLYRPDLADAFPRYPNADHAGFSFSAPLDLAPAEAVSLVFSVRTVGGEQRRETVPIQITDVETSSTALDHPDEPSARRAPLQLRVDRSVIGPYGELRIIGWAVARTQLEYVRVYAGGTLLGTAELGHSRPDIAQIWPDYPNAATSGFSFVHASAAPGDIATGNLKVVRIEAAAQGGILREVVVPTTSDVTPVEPGTDIAFHCDDVSLSEAGRLVISGWSASRHGISKVVVLFDGQQIGEAQLGLARPDVAQTFPTLAHAAQSGLAFSHQLAVPPTSEHLATIIVCAGNGVRVFHLPVTAEPVRAMTVEPMQAVSFEPVQADIDTLLRLEIDLPALAGRAALFPVRGSLRVEGWALARAGVATVCAYIDEVKSSEAYFGLRREDVAAAYSDWNDALRSGFGMSMPGKLLSPGEHSVRVALRDRLGRERSTTFSITVESPEERDWPEALRNLMPASERQLDGLVLSSLGWEPRLQLYMAMRNDEVEAARVTLAGLRDQAYRNWQLIVLVDEGESLPEIGRRLLGGFAPLADAVVVRARREPRPPGAETDSGASEHGVFCGILRPGDRLGPDALMEMTIETGLDPKADFIYSDERRRDPVSGRMAAYFKPDWSPDLLLSCNYVGRPWLARAELLRRADLDLGNSLRISEYEMVLRLTRVADRIIHVPKVLCERGAAELDDPESERTALRRTAQAVDAEAEILPACAPGIYRFKRAVKQRGLVSIILLTCGARDMVRTCVASIREVTGNQNFELICLDNIPASNTSTGRWVRNNTDKVVRLEGSFNWSRFNNVAVGAASSRAEYYLFLNDDTEAFEPDWLDALLEHGQRDEVGVTGALLLYPDRSIQHAALHMVEPGRGRHSSRFAREDDPGSFGRTLTQRNVIGVTGACMLVRRAFFEALEGFNEAHTVTNNDLDFCLRSLARGQRVVYTPYSRLIHHEMASRSSMNDLYNVESFEQEWRRTFAKGDPYYNPFLSRKEDNFTTDLEPVEVIYGGHPVMYQHEVRAILAIKLDHVGDFITAFPAFRRIKERFPMAKLAVLASTASVKLAALEPSIDEVIEFNFFNEKSSLGQIEISEATLAALRERLASQCFDIAIDLRKHFETRGLLRHTGAKLTAGFDSGSRFPWLDIVVEWDEDHPVFVKRQHVTDDLLRLVEAIFVACESDRRMITAAVTQRWEDKVLPDIADEGLFDKPVVCIHPAAGNELRTWPSKHFAELIDLILDEYDVNVAVIGGLGDSTIVDDLFTHLHVSAPVVSLVGRIPLERLPQFLARCALFVGNNSGPQHIAAGLGVPTVGIHSGVIDSHEWAPIGPAAVAVRRNMTCSPCYFALPEQCPRRLACLHELRPGDVLPTCRKLLAIRGWASRRESPPAA